MKAVHGERSEILRDSRRARSQTKDQLLSFDLRLLRLVLCMSDIEDVKLPLRPSLDGHVDSYPGWSWPDERWTRGRER